jgi:subtilisin-like proprotein convertase family protein
LASAHPEQHDLVHETRRRSAVVDEGVVTSTINVSGVKTFLLDLDVYTALSHTYSDDLDVTLTSPAGTIVTLTTDNAPGPTTPFNGTLWNDGANPGGQVPYTSNSGLVTDRNWGRAGRTPLGRPRKPLAAFVGEDPNGTWTLTNSDDAAADVGTLSQWRLDVKTGACLATTTTTTTTTSTSTSSTTTRRAAVHVQLDLDVEQHDGRADHDDVAAPCRLPPTTPPSPRRRAAPRARRRRRRPRRRRARSTLATTTRRQQPTPASRARRRPDDEHQHDHDDRSGCHDVHVQQHDHQQHDHSSTVAPASTTRRHASTSSTSVPTTSSTVTTTSTTVRPRPARSTTTSSAAPTTSLPSTPTTNELDHQRRCPMSGVALSVRAVAVVPGERVAALRGRAAKTATPTRRISSSGRSARGGLASLADLDDPANGAVTLGVASMTRPPRRSRSSRAPSSRRKLQRQAVLEEPGDRISLQEHKSAAPDGLTDVKLRVQRRRGAVARGQGEGREPRAVPSLDLTPPVRLQLVVSDSVGVTCWESHFPSAQKSDAGMFRCERPSRL